MANDYTIRLNNHVYQLLQPALPGQRGGRVIVEQRLDGTMYIRFKKTYLAYHQIGPADRTGLCPAPRSISLGQIPAEATQPRARRDKKEGCAAKTTQPSAVRLTFGRSGRTPAEPCPTKGKQSLPQTKAPRPRPGVHQGRVLHARTQRCAVLLKARQIALHRQGKLRDAALAKSARITLEQLSAQLAAGDVKDLPLIIKADVQGSVEVLSETLIKLSTDKVKIKVIHAGAGAITESDVLLASASNAVIIGFNVRPERKAMELAQLESVDIRLHTIIYNVTDEIKKAMVGLLAITYKETTLGRADVRDTFRITKVGTVAGCIIQDGKISRDSQIRLVRDHVVVHIGKIRSLRRFKDDVAEVKSGMECGISLENYNDVKVGDVIEAFVKERVSEPAMA